MKYLKTRLEVLSQEEIELIHEKTMEILEHTGLRVPHSKVLALAEEKGARAARTGRVPA